MIMRYGIQIGNWLLKPEKAWQYFLIIIAVFLHGNIIPIIWLGTHDSLELRIVLIGLLFQLIGISTVAWGLHETRKQFRRPGFFEIAQSWLKLFPKLKPRSLSISVNDTISLSMSGTLSLQEPQQPGPDSPFEERIVWLEGKITRLDTLVQEHKKQYEEKITKLTTDLTSERQSRETEDKEVRQFLEEVSIGGIHLESFGVLCLFIGTILTTLSNEIAGFYIVKWLNHFFMGKLV